MIPINFRKITVIDFTEKFRIESVLVIILAKILIDLTGKHRKILPRTSRPFPILSMIDLGEGALLNLPKKPRTNFIKKIWINFHGKVFIRISRAFSSRPSIGGISSNSGNDNYIRLIYPWIYIVLMI